MNIIISEEKLNRLVTKYIDHMLGVLEGEKNLLNTRVAYFDYKNRLVFVVDLKIKDKYENHKWSVSLQFLQRLYTVFSGTDEDKINEIVIKYFSEISGMTLSNRFTYLGGHDF
jgi:hypothetical protein